MKVSLNWLTDYVEIKMPACELAALLTRIGLNCESIEQTPTDIILDLEVTSNRPDWLGHIGVAREIAAATGAKFTPPQVDPAKIGPIDGRVADLTGVEVLDPQLCPRYTARVIRGVKVGPSPAWMVERLEAVGLRSINNVVDVTNYVMFEYSQPLHSFDYDKLAEHRVVVRRARDGEQLVSIDQTRCRLDDSMLIIADAAGPVAIAGVMGGLNTEVGDETQNVLIEAAQFDPLAVRKTSRKLMLLSESNYRFERGIDPVAVDAASLRACELILQLAGGRLAEGVVDIWADPYQPPTVALRPQRTNLLLGIEVPAERQLELLARLGLAPAYMDGKIICTIPPHRPDLKREADLIEEVARLVGYDQIPTAGKVTHSVLAPSATEQLRRRTGELLTAAGFDETITPSFADDAEAELFGVTETVRVDPLTRKTNNVLRPTVLTGLLRACKTNQDAGNGDDLSLFELANVFRPGGGALPEEHAELAMVTTRPLRLLRGAIEVLIERLSPQAKLTAQPAKVAGLAGSASAELLLDGQVIGQMGLIDPKVQQYYDLERPVAAAAINYEMLAQRCGQVRTYAPIPRTPAVKRDLSLIVDQNVTWRELIEAIGSIAQPLREAVDYVTTYSGEPIPAGRKSVTVTLTYRDPKGTLRSEQVDQQVQQILEALKNRLGAELRR